MAKKFFSKNFLAYRQGSPIGGGGTTPYPPREGQQNLQNWLNQGFFQKILCQSYSE